ncbi:TetR family transcriptional regulator [Murinocardiopsis flavida]|uniref:TetR family transcriptional regulator n=1 Tax=Murinocardiopsis flavida TaxID=645275 RepID=A0A2P8CDT6_9ACTN|nr:GntR family transcriptional regulator [Murinocardiopsis flavida]PSK83069.1 TetR family transcriptional regulator [Murinocardiopsis flavida]
MNGAASDQPPYAKVAAEIREQIRSGRLRPGDRVPSTREITRRWGVAMATATKVLAALQQEGLVRSSRGAGSVVADTTHTGTPRSARERHDPAKAVRTSPPGAPETVLDHAAIVRAAIAAADTSGIDALSMRRVAASLGVSAMALYRHVPNKDELIRAMAETVFRDHPMPGPPPADWREGIATAARLEWRIYRRHPWVAKLVSVSRPLLVPSGFEHTDWLARVMAPHTRDRNGVMYAVIVVTVFVQGMAAQLELETEQEQETGVSAAQWWDVRQPMMDRLEQQSPIPTLFGGDVPKVPDLDAAFEFGLARLLDGLASWFTAPEDDSG